jgi:hypothetical protein
VNIPLRARRIFIRISRSPPGGRGTAFEIRVLVVVAETAHDSDNHLKKSTFFSRILASA